MLQRIREKIKREEGAIFWGLCTFLSILFIAGFIRFVQTKKPITSVRFEKQAFSTGTVGSSAGEGSFIASKNGSTYYPKACKAVGRIKDENRLYFSSVQEAELAGFTPSKQCR
ncbi:MAG: hypothetical protein AAB372_02520 [Patescibacteria group bacterium]